MRLIDADYFKEQIASATVKENIEPKKGIALMGVVDSQPTAYDLDKVIDKINTIFKHHTATKIVQRLVVETIEAGVSN